MSEVIDAFAARIEREAHEDLPELGDNGAVWAPARDAAPAAVLGYDFYRAADITPFGSWPEIDARGDRFAIGVQRRTVNGVDILDVPSDHVAKHERLGHCTEKLALVRGRRGYPYMPPTPEVTVYDPEMFQERLWRLLACEGTFLGSAYASAHGANSHEWWAEVIGTVFDRGRQPFDTRINGTFGGRVPGYGDPAVVAFIRDLLRVEVPTMTTVSDPAGYTLSFPITRGFGVVTPGLERYGMHTGIDVGMPDGTPVPALHAGVVEIDDDDASYDAATPATWSGIAVWIRSDDGELWGYCHMERNLVARGQRVIAGEVIGFCGHTGAATGPHVHIERRGKNGVAIDPMEDITMLSQDAQDTIRKIVREEAAAVGRSIETKLDSGFNTTLVEVGRRIVAGDKDPGDADIDK